MPLLQFYAHLLFRAAALLAAGLALACLAVISVLGGALPGRSGFLAGIYFHKLPKMRH